MSTCVLRLYHGVFCHQGLPEMGLLVTTKHGQPSCYNRLGLIAFPFLLFFLGVWRDLFWPNLAIMSRLDMLGAQNFCLLNFWDKPKKQCLSLIRDSQIFWSKFFSLFLLYWRPFQFIVFACLFLSNRNFF